MGITGLLPLLKKASKNCHVRRFSGCTAAIDGFGWLHKGAFGCAAQLGKGEPTTAYVTYCLKYINVLVLHGVKPILVFDGRSLPAKAVTDNKRREKRAENKKRAQQCLREGNNKEAWECFTRCVEITPAMTRELIKVLRQQQIDYIIAPYEADAQLAYLSRKGIADIIITEDSDLVLFGCSKIFFKMNVNGDGVLFDSSKLSSCFGIPPSKFNLEDLRRMCILSGCDYLPSLPGIGLGKAKKVFMPPSSSDLRGVLNSVPQLIQLNISVPEEYILGFMQAEKTFLYQLAFDPITRTLVPLTPYAEDIDIKELAYAGAYIDNSVALDMALGNVDVKTKQRVDYFDPSSPKSGYKDNSMWSKNYKIPQKPALLATNEKKKETKSAHTTGLKISGSVRASLKKRQIDCQESDEKDEDILSLYKDKNKNVNENTTKRIRLQDSEEDEGIAEADDGPNVKNWSERALRSSARINPFIKSPEKIVRTIATLSDGKTIETKLSASSPTTYQKPLAVKDSIVVKSKYFKNSENYQSPTKNIMNENGVMELSPSIMTRSFYRKLGTQSKSQDEKWTKPELQDSGHPDDPEAAIISSDSDDDVQFLESNSTDKLSSSRGPIETNGHIFAKNPAVILNRLTQSFGNLRYATPTPKIQPSSNSTSSNSCRRMGLSKGARQTKIQSAKKDPNQKSLRDMFSAQPKSKI